MDRIRLLLFTVSEERKEKGDYLSVGVGEGREEFK